MTATTYVVHLTVDTGDADPAEHVATVERALRTADVINPPGVTGIQLDEARFDVVDILAAEPAR